MKKRIGLAMVAAMRGEQQLTATTLTNKIRGVVFWSGTNVKTKISYSNYAGTSGWSGTSSSLLLSGTYGWCQPNGG